MSDENKVEIEDEMLTLIESNCIRLNKHFKERYGVGIVCLLISEPKQTELERFSEMSDNLAEFLSDGEFEGAVIDAISENTIKFIPSSIMDEYDDDIADKERLSNEEFGIHKTALEIPETEEEWDFEGEPDRYIW